MLVSPLRSLGGDELRFSLFFSRSDDHGHADDAHSLMKLRLGY